MLHEELPQRLSDIFLARVAQHGEFGLIRFENDAVTDVSFASPLNKSLTGYSSPHNGGVNVGMLDGSVRFLGNKVDTKPDGGILQRLGDRADNQEIPSGILTEF